MASLRNTFKSFASRGCDPVAWEKYFRLFQAEQWEAEGGGVLQCFSDDERETDLIIDYWHGLGFLLKLSCRNLLTNRFEWSKLAVADLNKLDSFEELDDWHFPTGCFLEPARAWFAVEDFLTRPERPSERVTWVDLDDISWPEP